MSQTTPPVNVDEQVGPSDGSAAAASSGSDPSADATKQAEPTVDPVAEAKAEVARLRDQLLRTAADFDNYRKRTRRDVDEAQRRGAEELLKTLLPVFDNLERAKTSAEQSTDAKAIAEGVGMVVKQFVDVLSRANISRVESTGVAFDPLVHEAVQQIETPDAAPGTIVAEIAPGYRFGDKLVRAAMVVVARAPAAKA